MRYSIHYDVKEVFTTDTSFFIVMGLIITSIRQCVKLIVCTETVYTKHVVPCLRYLKYRTDMLYFAKLLT